MQYIRVEQDGPVKTITLTRGEKRNALNLAMLEEMTAAFREEPAPADRVIVLRAEGPAFCSGMDLAERLEKPVRRRCRPSSGSVRKRSHAMTSI